MSMCFECGETVRHGLSLCPWCEEIERTCAREETYVESESGMNETKTYDTPYTWNVDGADVGTCSKCKQEIYWCKSKAGKSVPVSADTRIMHLADGECRPGEAKRDSVAKPATAGTSDLSTRLDGLEKLLLKIAGVQGEQGQQIDSLSALVDDLAHATNSRANSEETQGEGQSKDDVPF